MLNVIIVDDEVLAAKNIEKGLRWEQLGIDQVYVAFSMKEAKEIFIAQDIHVMICDIEMPNGNGLELLKWVNEYYPNTVNVFLTCHADFSYAKEAIFLGSFDYLLKPIPFVELEAVVKRAVEKVNRWDKMTTYNKLGQHWVVNEARLLEQFWYDVMKGKLPNNPKEIDKAARLRKLEINTTQDYGLILIRIDEIGQMVSTWDKGIQEFTFKNVAAEILLEQDAKPIIVLLDDQRLMVLIKVLPETDFVQTFKHRCESYVEQCDKTLGTQIFCYLSNLIKLDEMKETTQLMLNIEENNVLFERHVLALTDIRKKILNYEQPNIKLWAILLSDGDQKQFLKEAMGYLDAQIEKKAINSDILNLFYHEFMHVLYTFLGEKGIEANLLFKDYTFKKAYLEATQSVKLMKIWIEQLVNKAFDYVQMVDETIPVVEKVKRYIDQNLSQDISREDLAQQVYMNPNYLARIFKKEVGMTPVDYLISERMRIAQELLDLSDLSISDISVKVGYTNFSYFSRLFKKQIGVSPNEYRQQRG